MANCKDANTVYASRDNCMSVCQHLEAGDPHEPGHTNTVACRHAAAIDAATGEKEISCQLAGPGGGGETGCGTSECANYCELYDAICSAALPILYPKQNNCVQNCEGLRDKGKLDPDDDHEGDTLQCRLVHVSAAETDLRAHCGHAVLANPTRWCNNDAVVPPLPPSCVDFCKLVGHVCTGELSVYENDGQCEKLCKHFDPGENADSTGKNTLGCRKYHTYNAMGQPEIHCPHVGPGGAGVCGDMMTGNCDSYCRISERACTSQFTAHFADVDDCLTQCSELDPGGKYSVAQADSESATLGCRFLALSRAAEAGPDSALCVDAFGDPGTACE
jgi:hypothetical protein